MGSSKACSVDHSQIVGQSFCNFCGEKIEPQIIQCVNGHNMAAKLKFCTECGSARDAVGISSQSPRVLNSRPSVVDTANPLYSEENLSSAPLDPWGNTNENQKDPMNTGINSPVVRGIAIGIGVLILVVIAITKLAGNIAITDVTVNMTLVGQDCSSVSWGYLDIPGGNVSLAVDGVDVASTHYTSYGTPVFNGCRFTATLPGIKENGSTYTLSSGNVLRGVLTDSQSELSGNNWAFDVSLGAN
jgi:hypothetical protein